MRAPHQRPDGFSVTASKTVRVDVERLSRAWTDTRQRNHWLASGTLRVRTSQPGRSARFDFRRDGTRVVVGFESKGEAKSTVSLEHERLPDAKAVEEMRGFWRDQLGRMAELLQS